MLKKVFKYLGITLLVVLGFLALYFLAVFSLSRIATNKNAAPGGEITMYILSNGVHTDLVLPISNDIIDWRETVSIEDTKANDNSAQWLAVGWGDKGFYLETPTWADLKFSTAFNAMFGLSSSALHTTFYKQMKVDENCRKIEISKSEYEMLVAYIQNSFEYDQSGKVIHIETDAVYGNNDAFYEGIGSYSLFYTCNTWANNGLKESNQKTCVWTPFDTGIFRFYK